MCFEDIIAREYRDFEAAQSIIRSRDDIFDYTSADYGEIPTNAYALSYSMNKVFSNQSHRAYNRRLAYRVAI